MDNLIVFYQLTRKIVHDKDDIPENARQVVYYSLAIGHHVGVMDCFNRLMEIPLSKYQTWMELLPEGEGRRKLEGVLKWSEIEINSSHANKILSALNTARPAMNEHQAKWTQILASSIQKMIEEPALYLMARKSVST